MKILHTSDWHLGRKLYDEERNEEFKAYLKWLSDLISKERPDALIVSGDIFDKFSPPQWAMKSYYDFLMDIKPNCGQIVIIAGNHDSTAVLESARTVLKYFEITIIGEPRTYEEEVVELLDAKRNVGAICCAVPFLRAKDVCDNISGRSAEEIEDVILEGFRKHYENVVQAAKKLRADREIPIIATGHCFVVGGKVVDDDGVRSLSVGSIDAVPLGIFPNDIDYLALGHLHTAQTCGLKNNFRYSGSPLCMGFGEAEQQKYVLMVEFNGNVPQIRSVPVPEFHKIRTLTGSFAEITKGIKKLEEEGSPVFLQVECTDEGEHDLSERIESYISENSPVKLLKIGIPKSFYSEFLSEADELSEELTPEMIFNVYLKENNVEEQEAKDLTDAFREIVNLVMEGENR